MVEEYALEASHLRLLLARESGDRCDEARRLMARDGLTITDRFGQVKRHPAAGFEAEARLACAKLLRELDLEGEPHPSYRRR